MPDLSELLLFAVEQRASDLHLKPGSRPVVRRDGSLEAAPFPALTADEVEQLAAALTPPGAGPGPDGLGPDGQGRFAYEGPARFRVHVFRQSGSLALALRVVPALPSGFEVLGFPPVARRLSDETRGLLLVAGPSGSGRTTTTAAILDHINETQARHIVTIEDPIEVVHHSKRSIVSQREVGRDAAEAATALSAVLAQDVDVVFAGTLASAEVVTAALDVAGQGRLVLGVLDTTDVATTLDRIVDLFPAHRHARVRAALAGCLRGILCQRLLERVDGKGRIPAVEVLLGTGRAADAIVNGEGAAGLEQIMAEGEYHGMQTFDQSVFTLYKNGLIGLGDALAAATHPHDLRVTLQQAGLDTV